MVLPLDYIEEIQNDEATSKQLKKRQGIVLV